MFVLLNYMTIGIDRWYFERRETSNKCTSDLCPKKDVIWSVHVDISRAWHVGQCPSGVFIVRSTPSVIVDLVEKTCTCYQWKVRGFLMHPHNCYFKAKSIYFHVRG